MVHNKRNYMMSSRMDWRDILLHDASEGVGSRATKTASPQRNNNQKQHHKPIAPRIVQLGVSGTSHPQRTAR